MAKILQFPQIKQVSEKLEKSDDITNDDLEIVRATFEQSRQDFYKLNPVEKYQLFEAASMFGENIFKLFIEQRQQIALMELQLLAVSEMLSIEEDN